MYGWISADQHLEVNMSNNKQTSLDWFLDELLQLGYIKRLPVTELQQAKAMYKQELMQALNDGKAMVLRSIENKSLEQYYNETYGGNNEQ